MKNFTLSLLLLLTLLLTFSSIWAQTPIIKYFSVAGSHSSVFNSVEDLPGGGYLAVGTVKWFNKLPEIWIWRLDGKGDSLWTKRYRVSMPYAGNQWVVSTKVASDKSLFILIGAYDGSCSFNSVMKTDAQGNSLWNVIISPKTEYASAQMNDILATPDGGCIVAGGISYGDNPRVVKISSSGTISWESLLSSTNSSFNSVCITSDGGYIAAGRNSAKWTNIKSLLAAKFSNSGATVWSKTFYSGVFNSGDSIQAEGLSVASTNDGGCLIAGYLTDPGNGNRSSTLLMKLNSSGDSMWTKIHYGPVSAWGKAKAYRLMRLPDNKYLMFSHRESGSTVPLPILLKMNDMGEPIWSQVGYAYYIMMNGVDSGGGILFNGDAEGLAVFIRATSGGVYKSPELITPYNEDKNIEISPTLIWRGWPWTFGPPHIISKYHVQIAKDSAFMNIVLDQSNVTSETLKVNTLFPYTKYIWRVQSFGAEGGPTPWSPVFSFTTGVGTSVETIDGEIPLSFSLQQNYPNPFNPNTVIRFSLPHKAKVLLEVFNLLGQRVEVLIDEELDASSYKVNFNAKRLASGIYFYRLITNDFVQAKKMLLIK